MWAVLLIIFCIIKLERDMPQNSLDLFKKSPTIEEPKKIINATLIDSGVHGPG